jgi:hypothetical protein
LVRIDDGIVVDDGNGGPRDRKAAVLIEAFSAFEMLLTSPAPSKPC